MLTENDLRLRGVWCATVPESGGRLVMIDTVDLDRCVGLKVRKAGGGFGRV